MTRHASIVLPRPTSSASSRRAGVRRAQLVRDQFDPRAEHAPARVRARVGLPLQHLAPELELVVAVDAARQQPRIGLRYRLLGVELAFRMHGVAAVVDDQFALAFGAAHGLVLAADAHALAGAEHRAQQRRRAERVHAHDAAAGEHDLHLAPGEPHHGAEPQLGFGAGEPALAGREGIHRGDSIPAARNHRDNGV